MTEPLFQRAASGELYYYQNDHLGTPQRMLDKSGAVVWEARYSAFGKAEILVEIVGNNLRFPGQYFDGESGLHQNYRREYEPTTGRYLQKDPIGLLGGINNYIYVYSSPIVYVDPTGEFGFVGAIIGAVVDLVIQLSMNGWNLNCVSWTQVGGAAVLGAIGGGAYRGVFKHTVLDKKWSELDKKWSSVSRRYRKAQERAGNAPDGEWDAHHWAFPRRGEKGPTWKNHPANLKPVPREIHQRIHGNHPDLPRYDPIRRWWHGTPEWAKSAQTAFAGGISGDISTLGDCEC